MATLNVLLTCLILLRIVIIKATTSTPKLTSQKKLVIKMIHVDTLHPNAPIWELTQRAINRSFARKNYLSTRLGIGRQRYGITDRDANAIPIYLLPSIHYTVFLVDVSIGSPPVPQLLSVDTGSPFTWIRCAPCSSCGEQLPQLFDPTKSSTYSPISCSSSQCRSLGYFRDKCGEQDSCTFNISYLDGSKSVGNVVSEQATITTTDDVNIQLPIKILGCGNDVTMVGNEESGILGLGDTEYSIINGKLGGIFSYCIGRISDPKYESHQLILGKGACLEGSSTPIDIYGSHYYVKLLYITVGGNRLTIDPVVFTRRGDGGGGVFIDSGCTVTYLIRPAYNVLYDEVRSLVPSRFRQKLDDPDLCYQGTLGDEDKAADFVPQVTFHFEGGATIEHSFKDLFWQQYRGFYCMAIRSMNTESVIGIISQQNYNVGYDTVNKKLYLMRIDCQYLDDYCFDM